MDNEIYLLTGEFVKVNGYQKFSETSRTFVYADCGDPVRSQRDLAQKQGYVAKLKIRMNKLEYGGQRFIEWQGKGYEVKESFGVDDEIIELTCSDMRV